MPLVVPPVVVSAPEQPGFALGPALERAYERVILTASVFDLEKAFEHVFDPERPFSNVFSSG